MTAVLDLVERLFTGLMVAFFVALTALVTWQVASRYLDPLPSALWTEEVARFCFVWMLFLGAAIAVRRNTHFVIDVMPGDRVVGTPRRIIDLVAPTVVAVVAAIMVVGGIRYVALGMDRVSVTSGVSLGLVYLAIPVTGAAILAFALERIVRLARGQPVRDEYAIPSPEDTKGLAEAEAPAQAGAR